MKLKKKDLQTQNLCLKKKSKNNWEYIIFFILPYTKHDLSFQFKKKKLKWLNLFMINHLKELLNWLLRYN